MHSDLPGAACPPNVSLTQPLKAPPALCSFAAAAAGGGGGGGAAAAAPSVLALVVAGLRTCHPHPLLPHKLCGGRPSQAYVTSSPGCRMEQIGSAEAQGSAPGGVGLNTGRRSSPQQQEEERMAALTDLFSGAAWARIAASPAGDGPGVCGAHGAWARLRHTCSARSS